MKHIISQSLAAFLAVAGVSSAVAADDTGTSTPASLAIVVTPSLTSVRTNTNLPQEQGFSQDRKLGWGGGFLLDSPLAPGLSLGIGALYIQRKFQIGTGANRFERKVPTVFVPVEAKVWLGNMLSIGGGAFGALKVGDQTDTVVIGGAPISATSNPDRNSFEYGLTASAHLLFPVAERTGVILGARYLYGLNNASKSLVYNEKIDDFTAEAGLSFSM